jgi:hypothetical protein
VLLEQLYGLKMPLCLSEGFAKGVQMFSAERVHGFVKGLEITKIFPTPVLVADRCRQREGTEGGKKKGKKQN